MTVKEEEPIYVGIENPIEVRRALLESSKELIHILQANDKFKVRKAKKQLLVMKLKQNMKETHHLIAQLRTLMPKIKLSTLPRKVKVEVPQARAEVIPQKVAIPKPMHKPKMNEAEKLELELKEIEEKLSRL